jgi:dUTP pyrophosphatase
VGVILFNHSDVDFQIKTGDRVAQLILERIAIAEVEDVGADGSLEQTVRGEGGFGSSGSGAIIDQPAAKRMRTTGESTAAAAVAATTPVS